MRQFKKFALVTCTMLCGVSGGTCFTEGLDAVRQALLPPESTPGTCFQLELGDNLIELPCALLD